jgi:Flp pilus assembly protein TadB
MLLAVVGGVFGIFLPGMYVKRQQAKRLIKFSNQLGDMLNLMVNGLRAGYATTQALEAVSKELPAPICDEFRRVVQEMQLGISMVRRLITCCAGYPVMISTLLLQQSTFNERSVEISPKFSTPSPTQFVNELGSKAKFAYSLHK